MKASFNSSSITNLIGRHIEKAILALVCLFALFLAYGGIAESGGLDWEPSRLETESSSAETELDTRVVRIVTDWQDKATRLQAALDISKSEVDNIPYDHEKNWTLTAFTANAKRNVPLLFAMEDLRARAGSGAVQMISDARAKADEDLPMASRSPTEGQRWVVLTASIPLEKQQEAYDEAFKDAYQDPDKDVPSYAYYYVERAEVDRSGSATELQWKLLHTKLSLEKQNLWTAQQPEIISDRFLLPPVNRVPMAFPLPPVTNRTWGPEIAHEPDIPFYYEMQLATETEDPSGLDSSGEPGPDVPGMGPSIRRPGYRGSGRPGMGDMDEMSSMMDDEMEMSMGMMGGYRGMRFGEEPATVRLFRFFDFDVLPGKHYRYRVRLLLANPNQDIPPEYLERAEDREVKFLESEFCDPTDVVTVPEDSRLLCVNVKGSANLSVEPTAHMMSVRFNPETGEESAAEHERLYRGQLANFFEIPIETASAAAMPTGYESMMEDGGSMDMMDMMMGEEGARGGRRPPARGRRSRRDKDPKEEPELVDHLTEHIVLDFHGGERIDRKLIRPCSVLLLDPSGQLVIRSDLDDLEQYLTYYVPKEDPRKKKSREEMMMDGMEGMMEYEIEMEEE